MMSRVPVRLVGRGLAAATLSVLVSGCSVLSIFKKDEPPKTRLESVKIIAATDANEQSATFVDVVFAYQPSVAASLPKTAAEWFAKKGNIINGASGAIDVMELQIGAPDLRSIAKAPLFGRPPAGQLSFPSRFDDAIAVRAYAAYVVDGVDGMLDLTALENPRIRLGAKTVTVSETAH